MTYEYWCPECREVIDYICKMNDKPKAVRCEECGHLAKPMPSKVGDSHPKGRLKGGYERSKF